jgi:hypothetical protein
MLFLRKLFKLPSPVDLGWSEYNALEDEDFSDEPKGKTWQDWHRAVKEMHPVKYWIAETFGDFVRYKVWFPIKRPFETAHYWFVSHFVPSRRYHMLDLRQPRKVGDVINLDCYRYGWRDVPEKMLYAMFNLLGEYLNDENPHDLTQWYTREQIEADEGMKKQQADIEEGRAIYQWWTVGRHEEEEMHSKLLHDWCEARRAKASNKEHLWEMLQQYKEYQENKTDEMIARLMKIRRTLWT